NLSGLGNLSGYGTNSWTAQYHSSPNMPMRTLICDNEIRRTSRLDGERCAKSWASLPVAWTTRRPASGSDAMRVDLWNSNRDIAGRHRTGCWRSLKIWISYDPQAEPVA